jgi:hypothetical protein
MVLITLGARGELQELSIGSFEDALVSSGLFVVPFSAVVFLPFAFLRRLMGTNLASFVLLAALAGFCTIAISISLPDDRMGEAFMRMFGVIGLVWCAIVGGGNAIAKRQRCR